MKTIRQLWDASARGEVINSESYRELVDFVVQNHNKIFPDDKDFIGVYWGKLGCWDKNVGEAKIIIERIIRENEQ